MSEMLWYLDRTADESVARVALVHQYHRPNCTVGASGKPDPKWLRDGDLVLMPDIEHDPATCTYCQRLATPDG